MFQYDNFNGGIDISQCLEKMMAHYKLTISLVATLLLFEGVFAGRASLPHPGGNGGAEFGENSVVARTSGGSINLVTGQPSWHINLVNISSKSGFEVGADLHYGGNVQSQAGLPNESLLDNACGLGWFMGWSSIFVEHNGTTTSEDDRWYYRYSNGTISEILKEGSTYMIKNEPYWKIVPEFATLVTGDTPIIIGWTITQPNGCVYRYGDFVLTHDGSLLDGSRMIWRGEDPSLLETGDLAFYVEMANDNSLIKPFYYRWDIKNATDVNGSSIDFEYQQHRYWLGDGPSYCVSSHVKSITTDAGYSIVFDVELKTAAEGNALQAPGGFIIIDRNFLRSLHLLDGSREVEQLSFTYTGDVAQPPHLNAGETGYEKRLLTRITSTRSNSRANTAFEYDRRHFPGYLTQVSQPMTGKTTTYLYGLRTLSHTDGARTEDYGVVTVDAIRETGGVQGEPARVTDFSYSIGTGEYYYAPTTRMPYFSGVTSNSGTGNVKYTMDADPTHERFGSILRIDLYGSAGSLVSSRVMTETPKSFLGGAFNYLLNTRAEETTDGVLGITGSPLCGYDYVQNGMPSILFATNSDEVSLVTKREFACQYYSGMGDGAGGKNMLSQIAYVKKYKVPAYQADCVLDDSKIVEATFTTWSDVTGVWRPSKAYAWKVAMDGNGNVKRDASGNPRFVDFSLSSPTSNSWVLTGETVAYNDAGQVLDLVNAAGTHSASIYRNDYSLPIATVTNSRYEECAYFPCDYDVGDPSHSDYYDYENGWQKAASVLSSAKKHFGEKSVYVDLTDGSAEFGPSRNVRIYQGSDYIISAWVLVEPGGPLIINGDYRYLQTTTIPHQTSDKVKSFSVQGATASPSTEWQYIELRIPASKDLSAADWSSHDWCVRMFVGAPNGVKAYIDDIRFYPVDALMATMYYDMTWRKPSVTVDANGNPGQLLEYDTFGRPMKWYKVNKHKSASDAGYKTLRRENEYHLMGNDLRLVFPNGNETLRAGQQYAITWTEGDINLDEDGVDVLFFDGSNWNQIASAVKDQTSHLWTVPASAATGCLVKLIAHDNTDIVDLSDAPFEIDGNSPPAAPVGVAPSDNSEITATASELAQGKKIILEWETASDPDGDPVSYRVFVQSQRVADDYRATSCEVTVNGLGTYTWYVEAKDGGGVNVASEQMTFNVIEADWFLIRDVDDKIVESIPVSLFTAVSSTLSSEDQTKFADTYSVENDGKKWLEVPYSEDLLSNGQTIHYKIKTATELGDAGGWREAYDGQIIGQQDRETRNFILEQTGVGTYPQLTIYMKYFDTTNDEYDKSNGTWGTEYLTTSGDHDMSRFRLTTTSTGYHFWYRTWPYNEGSGWTADWKTNDEWTDYYNSCPVCDGVSHVQIYLFKY